MISPGDLGISTINGLVSDDDDSVVMVDEPFKSGDLLGRASVSTTEIDSLVWKSFFFASSDELENKDLIILLMLGAINIVFVVESSVIGIPLDSDSGDKLNLPSPLERSNELIQVVGLTDVFA